MPQIAQVIQEGLGRKDKKAIEDSVVWTVEGDVTGAVSRFGSVVDQTWFRILRWISVLGAAYVPFFLGFLSCIPEHRTTSEGLNYLLIWLVIDVVYGAGTLSQLRISTIEISTAVECVDPKQITRQRLQSFTFWLDVVSLFGILWIPTGWRLFSMLYLLRTWRLMSSSDDLYELHQSQFETDSPAHSMIILLAKMLLMIHIIACGWFAACATGCGKDVQAHLRADPRWFGGDIFWVYTISFSRGACMLAGWGWPEPFDEDDFTKEERVFHACGAPFAGLSSAYIFSQIIMITSSVSSAERHLNYMADISANVVSLNVPEDVKKRVLQYHTFLSVHNVLRIANLGADISSDLSKELRLFLFEKIVTDAPFFQDVDAHDIIQMIMAFTEAAFAPDEFIIHKGEIGREVYFILKGAVRVLTSSDECVAVKESGEYFGEVALLLDTERSASVQSACYSLVAVLDRDSIVKTFEHNPDSKKRVFKSLYKSQFPLTQSSSTTPPPMPVMVTKSPGMFSCCSTNGTNGMAQIDSDEDDPQNMWGVVSDSTPLLTPRDDDALGSRAGSKSATSWSNWLPRDRFWSDTQSSPKRSSVSRPRGSQIRPVQSRFGRSTS